MPSTTNVAAPAPPSLGESQNPSSYFQLTKLHWMLVIGVGLALYTWAVFSPQTIPYNWLGIIGTFIKYMVDNHYTLFKIGYYGSWMIHVAEAFISFRILEAKGVTDPVAKLKWFIQTIFFGFGSFGLLLAYNPQKKK